MITVNGSAIPTPSKFNVGVFDVSKAERNCNATMIIERIATKKKLEMEWSYLPNSDLSTLLSIFSSNVFFTVVYPDPVTNANATITCYCGDRSTEMLSYLGSTPAWRNVKMNFIQK